MVAAAQKLAQPTATGTSRRTVGAAGITGAAGAAVADAVCGCQSASGATAQATVWILPAYRARDSQAVLRPRLPDPCRSLGHAARPHPLFPWLQDGRQSGLASVLLAVVTPRSCQEEPRRGWRQVSPPGLLTISTGRTPVPRRQSASRLAASAACSGVNPSGVPQRVQAPLPAWFLLPPVLGPGAQAPAVSALRSAPPCSGFRSAVTPASTRLSERQAYSEAGL